MPVLLLELNNLLILFLSFCVSAGSFLPDWTWAQCDRCLKWRRLPDSVDPDSLPAKWYCRFNPDATHNRCDIPEEPEDEDLAVKPKFTKTFKKKQEETKRQQRMIQLEIERKQNGAASSSRPPASSSLNSEEPLKRKATVESLPTVENKKLCIKTETGEIVAITCNFGDDEDSAKQGQTNTPPNQARTKTKQPAKATPLRVAMPFQTPKVAHSAEKSNESKRAKDKAASSVGNSSTPASAGKSKGQVNSSSNGDIVVVDLTDDDETMTETEIKPDPDTCEPNLAQSGSQDEPDVKPDRASLDLRLQGGGVGKATAGDSSQSEPTRDIEAEGCRGLSPTTESNLEVALAAIKERVDRERLTSEAQPASQEKAHSSRSGSSSTAGDENQSGVISEPLPDAEGTVDPTAVSATANCHSVNQVGSPPDKSAVSDAQSTSEHTAQSHSTSKPSNSGGNSYEPSPSETATVPSHSTPVLGDSTAMPGDTTGTPSDTAAMPSESTALSSDATPLCDDGLNLASDSVEMSDTSHNITDVPINSADSCGDVTSLSSDSTIFHKEKTGLPSTKTGTVPTDNRVNSPATLSDRASVVCDRTFEFGDHNAVSSDNVLPLADEDIATDADSPALRTESSPLTLFSRTERKTATESDKQAGIAETNISERPKKLPSTNDTQKSCTSKDNHHSGKSKKISDMTVDSKRQECHEIKGTDKGTVDTKVSSDTDKSSAKQVTKSPQTSTHEDADSLSDSAAVTSEPDLQQLPIQETNTEGAGDSPSRKADSASKLLVEKQTSDSNMTGSEQDDPISTRTNSDADLVKVLQSRLEKMQKNMYTLLKLLVPDEDIGDIDNVEQIIEDMITIKSQDQESQSQSLPEDSQD
ncbi:MORC family CW-type Zinc finger protein 4 [Plakobranchus ocellatus]|uniref:MORC family CW-type Zinc finger protein 4 n=1 Tax=Plakobranchus ocellatus TaxID=259542 RepID=A0AAV4BCS8_9GAST|nr:MORC family CW-type Zinc finger protein 4 [Plakobranchus ocellatus]